MPLFSRLFGARRPPHIDARLAPGVRAYAVGDIHGRLDLLDMLLEQLDADNRSRGDADTSLIFLGDYIDRGPQSMQVIERLRTFRPHWAEPIHLRGNHEEAFLDVLTDKPHALRPWLSFGGVETLESYGLDQKVLTAPAGVLAAAIHAAVPLSHRQFLAGLRSVTLLGDYLFVHAGIRPGIGLDAQKDRDLRWIREDFLDDERSHGVMVVHGHTISKEADFRANRIGIDTGAYASGILTAIGLEGSERWLVQTGMPR